MHSSLLVGAKSLVVIGSLDDLIADSLARLRV